MDVPPLPPLPQPLVDARDFIQSRPWDRLPAVTASSTPFTLPGTTIDVTATTVTNGPRFSLPSVQLPSVQLPPQLADQLDGFSRSVTSRMPAMPEVNLPPGVSERLSSMRSAVDQVSCTRRCQRQQHTGLQTPDRSLCLPAACVA